MDPARSPAKALLLALPLITAAMAGCIGEEESDLPWSSYEDAQSAPGPTFSPIEEQDPTRVKWLMPESPDSVPQGQSAIWLLIYDSEADEPVTGATLHMGSYMPAMGHGTAAEEAPTHQEFGLYKGVINPTMGGDWQLNLTVELPPGKALDFEISYTAEGGGGMDGDMGGDGHDHDHGGNMSDGNETSGNMTGGNGTADGNETTNETQPEGFQRTFNGSIETTAEYSESFTFPVNSTSFGVEATIQFNATDPLAEVNVTLQDANGTDVDSAEVTEDGGTATITVEAAPNTGEWTAAVTGQGLEASYTVKIVVG